MIERKCINCGKVFGQSLDDAAYGVDASGLCEICRGELPGVDSIEFALKLEPIIAEKATERMIAGKPLDPMQKSAQGKTRDELARIAGVSHDTIEKAKLRQEKYHLPRNRGK